ncbi:hypothetical protein N0V85_006856 [Neurospora sp. IMI 360204]|nr:hypothetical protein N0V85_006856 [Neurospora sp. IMI 360204]
MSTSQVQTSPMLPASSIAGIPHDTPRQVFENIRRWNEECQKWPDVALKSGEVCPPRSEEAKPPSERDWRFARLDNNHRVIPEKSAIFPVTTLNECLLCGFALHLASQPVRGPGGVFKTIETMVTSALWAISRRNLKQACTANHLTLDFRTRVSQLGQSKMIDHIIDQAKASLAQALGLLIDDDDDDDDGTLPTGPVDKIGGPILFCYLPRAMADFDDEGDQATSSYEANEENEGSEEEHDESAGSPVKKAKTSKPEFPFNKNHIIRPSDEEVGCAIWDYFEIDQEEEDKMAEILAAKEAEKAAKEKGAPADARDENGMNREAELVRD